MSWVTIDGLRARVGSAAYKWLVRNKGRLHGWVKKHRKPKPVTLYMYDDVNLSLIPKNAQAVAGYVGGRWPTYAKLHVSWPSAKHLSIAVTSRENADVLDVEKGDASPDQAASWIRRQTLRRKRGVKYNTRLPVVYTSISQGKSLLNLLDSSGLKYGKDFLYWSAHYDPAMGKHLCSPKCGFGMILHAHATQYTDKALGRSLDESIVSPGFFL